MKPNLSGRRNNLILQNRIKQPLQKRAEKVFGSDGRSILQKLREGCPHRSKDSEGFDRWARNVLTKCSRLGSSVEQERYVAACIRKEARVHELGEWLSNHPDPRDVLDPEELRELGKEKVKVRIKKIADAEFELEALTSEDGGGKLLVKRVGMERALAMMLKLSSIIDPERAAGSRRMNYLLMRAADRHTKYPERYIDKIVECEPSKVRNRKSR